MLKPTISMHVGNSTSIIVLPQRVVFDFSVSPLCIWVHASDVDTLILATCVDANVFPNVWDTITTEIDGIEVTYTNDVDDKVA